MSLFSLPIRVQFNILAHAEVADIYAFGQASIASSALMNSYLEHAFDIDRRLMPFFNNVDNMALFREALKDSAALVTGPFMLNLFGRQDHVNKKLVISVCAGDGARLVQFFMRIKYRYVPHRYNTQTWLEELQDANAWGANPRPDEMIPVVGSLRFYNSGGYCIQLDLTRCCAFEALISCQSTLLLSAFDGDIAFCLYPHLLFVSKGNAVLDGSVRSSKTVLDYYSDGWSVVAETGTRQTLDEALRFVGDSDTWVLGFSEHNRKGIMGGNYLSVNSWVLKSGWRPGQFRMEHDRFGSSRMHSDYCVVDFDEAVRVYSAVLDSHHGDKCQWYEEMRKAEVIGSEGKKKKRGNSAGQHADQIKDHVLRAE
ncbi:hypothetical protein C8J56DRAFT_894051 [Mycena floridula]|nr:hypothetical protein C8J56DRAFT_894051 [Mycena floridula]